MTLSRRAFVAATSGILVSSFVRAAQNNNADIVIIGGGTGGVAAALAACRGGAKKVIMTEETDWIGGQLTSQLVPPDENHSIESGGGTKSYRDFRTAVRLHYRKRTERAMRPDFRDTTNLNPGNGWVSRLCHEPRVAVMVLEETLKPFVANGQLTIHRQCVPISATLKGDRVESVTLLDRRTGNNFTLSGDYFIDATEEGDLLPLAKVEYVTGSESKAMTGEPNAADKPRPNNIQSFTWCFILEHDDGKEHVIDEPKDYDFWKSFPNADKPLFQWNDPAFSFYPKGDRDPEATKPNFWTYRRVIDSKMFVPGSYVGDVSVINWHMNDYTLGSLHGSTPEKAAEHRERSRQMSMALVYWLQTESPRSDGKKGWPGLRLCPEQTGTKDGLAMAAYIRESRRIKADFTILEQHVSKPIRDREFGKDKATAEPFKDSVGIGHYLYMDLHQTSEGEKKGGSQVYPFQIPLGALLPVRVRNVLPACKNLGVTHLTNGCYRLHPVEWNIGEAAGALAAYCIAKDLEPKQVRADAKRLAEYRDQLTKLGVLLEWPANSIRKF